MLLLSGFPWQRPKGALNEIPFSLVTLTCGVGDSGEVRNGQKKCGSEIKGCSMRPRWSALRAEPRWCSLTQVWSIQAGLCLHLTVSEESSWDEIFIKERITPLGLRESRPVTLHSKRVCVCVQSCQVFPSQILIDLKAYSTFWGHALGQKECEV